MAGIQQRHHQQRTIAPVSKARLQGVDQGIKFVEMAFGLRFAVEMRHLVNRVFATASGFLPSLKVNPRPAQSRQLLSDGP
jgi:hypothetical protein